MVSLCAESTTFLENQYKFYGCLKLHEDRQVAASDLGEAVFSTLLYKVLHDESMFQLAPRAHQNLLNQHA